MAPKDEFLKKTRVIAEAVAKASECELLSLNFSSTKEGKVLRVVIDGTNTGLEVCEAISRKLSEWLDEHENEISVKEYTLEVSSPGMDKPLREVADFKKLIGKLIYAETKTKAADGRKRYTGRLIKIENGILFIYVEKESAEFRLPINDLSKARAEYDFREE